MRVVCGDCGEREPVCCRVRYPIRYARVAMIAVAPRYRGQPQRTPMNGPDIAAIPMTPAEVKGANVRARHLPGRRAEVTTNPGPHSAATVSRAGIRAGIQALIKV